jgi:hypothetical protein
MRRKEKTNSGSDLFEEIHPLIVSLMLRGKCASILISIITFNKEKEILWKIKEK